MLLDVNIYDLSNLDTRICITSFADRWTLLRKRHGHLLTIILQDFRLCKLCYLRLDRKSSQFRVARAQLSFASIPVCAIISQPQ